MVGKAESREVKFLVDGLFRGKHQESGLLFSNGSEPVVTGIVWNVIVGEYRYIF